MKLAIASAVLLTASAQPAAAPEPVTPAPASPMPAAQIPVPPPADAEAFRDDPMNVHRNPDGCKSVLRQVQEEGKSAAARRGEARTLDREPAAHLLLAVDRSVNGCREVTFLRRNAAPGSAMLNPRAPARD